MATASGQGRITVNGRYVNPAPAGLPAKELPTGTGRATRAQHCTNRPARTDRASIRHRRSPCDT